MKAIFKRELKAYFTNPIGYIVLAIMWVYSAMVFSTLYASGSADITAVFSSMFLIMFLMLPLLTMRTFSEEKRQKTEQLFMTAPTSLWGVVMGKFFAAITVFMIGIAPTFIYEMLFMVYVTPEWLVYFANLLGTFLFGAAFVAIGLLISSCTESQVVSAIVTFAVAIVLILMDTIGSLINVSWVTTALNWLSFYTRYNVFTKGTIDLSNVLFFVSMTGIFSYLTVNRLDRKRWA